MPALRLIFALPAAVLQHVQVVERAKRFTRQALDVASGLNIVGCWPHRDAAEPVAYAVDRRAGIPVRSSGAIPATH